MDKPVNSILLLFLSPSAGPVTAPNTRFSSPNSAVTGQCGGPSGSCSHWQRWTSILTALSPCEAPHSQRHPWSHCPDTSPMALTQCSVPKSAGCGESCFPRTPSLPSPRIYPNVFTITGNARERRAPWPASQRRGSAGWRSAHCLL